MSWRRKKPPGLTLDLITVSSDLAEPTKDQKSQKSTKSTKKVSELGELKESDFELIAELGNGIFSTVYKVKHKLTGKLLARKVLRLQPRNKVISGQILDEMELLNELHHPAIVTFYGYFPHEVSSFANDDWLEISICMESMDASTLDALKDSKGRVPEECLKWVGWSLLDVLIYLTQTHDLVYKNIEPSKLLCSTAGEVKLYDFSDSMGLFQHQPNVCHQERSPLRCYMAPETLLQDPNYTSKVVVWRLGIVLLELGLGQFPIPALSETTLEKIFGDMSIDQPNDSTVDKLEAKSMFDLLDLIANGPTPAVPPDRFSPEFSTFIEKALAKEPDQRPDFDELLKHPFLAAAQSHKNDFANWVKK